MNNFKIVIVLFTLMLSLRGISQSPHVSGGSAVHIEKFPSAYVDARNIDIWLPENYVATKKYAVLYMHDGQMLYDSTSNWNKQEWKVDECLSKLMADGLIHECIVVGISNNNQFRHTEYFPEKPVMSLPSALRDTLVSKWLMGKPLADEYLKFITKELKPFIDKNYSVYTDPKHTFIAGSSMGGLISMYAICEYPDVFGGAACLSTHWPGVFKANTEIPDAFNDYLNKNLPNPKTHKIYFDYGTETLDALYKPYQLMVDETMKKHGYNLENWMTKEFPGANHSEKAWAKRLDIPLTFLLEKIK